MPSQRAWIRFFKYALTGMLTSAVDVGVLWFLTEQAHLHYLLSVVASFLTAMTIGYLLDRQFVFTPTHRGLRAGYFYFLIINSSGLLMTLVSMLALVEVLNIHYLFARILIICGVGLWNYLMNLYVNFKVAGKY